MQKYREFFGRAHMEQQNCNDVISPTRIQREISAKHRHEAFIDSHNESWDIVGALCGMRAGANDAQYRQRMIADVN